MSGFLNLFLIGDLPVDLYDDNLKVCVRHISSRGYSGLTQMSMTVTPTVVEQSQVLW